MPVDVSVIMPAYQASATIQRAVASVFAQEGVTAELVLCADDELDYGSLLPADLRSMAQLTLCRTPSPRSGPSVARNVALRHARADIIASSMIPLLPKTEKK
jgi:glycosyltransferase involved in cell wall biosynthesis